MTLKTLFRWHLWFGLITGVCLTIVAVTGSLAVFAPEIDWLVVRPLRVSVPAAATSSRANLDELLAKVRAAYPEARVATLHLSVRPAFAHIVALQVPKLGDTPARRIDVYVNPYTSEIQGERLVTGGYFSSVYQFLRQTHVRLLMGLWGRVFVGVLGVTLILSCITGLYIYRGWLKKLFTLRFTGGWRSRGPWAETHKFIGVWSLLFNLLIGATGAVLGIENLTNQINTKWVQPSRAKVQDPEAEAARAKTLELSKSAGPTLPVETLLAKAREAFPDLTPRVVTLPTRDGGTLSIRGAVPSMLVAQSHVRSANGITLNSSTGAVINQVDAREFTGWRRIYWSFDPLHFGYFGGLPTKIIWFVLGLTPGVLAITGTWMWWKRRSRATASTKPVQLDPAHARLVAARWRIAGVIGSATLAAAYAIVATAFKDWSFTHRMAEFWLVKPVAIALCVFPVTGLLAWLIVRWRTQLWLYGAVCTLMGGWYLVLTKILL